jgi:hypothetical protein
LNLVIRARIPALKDIGHNRNHVKMIGALIGIMRAAHTSSSE